MEAGISGKHGLKMNSKDANRDNLRLRNIALISFASLIVIEIACFFLFDIRQFYGILTSGLLTFSFFIVTLVVYLRAARSSVQARLKYLMIVLFAKIAASAVAFYLVYRFNYIDYIYFLFSFLIFFTIFFNLEIFLIYKRVLYYKQ
jgi:hypothetical protein